MCCFESKLISSQIRLSYFSSHSEGKSHIEQKSVPRVISASTAKQMRTAIFWVITQPVLVIHYRLCGITYRYHLAPWRNVCKNLPLVAAEYPRIPQFSHIESSISARKNSAGGGGGRVEQKLMLGRIWMTMRPCNSHHAYAKTKVLC
jgi:hypothetical protein